MYEVFVFAMGMLTGLVLAYLIYIVAQSQKESVVEPVDSRLVLEMLVVGDDGEHTLVKIVVQSLTHAQRMLNMHNLFNIASAKVWNPVRCRYIAHMDAKGILRGKG